MKIREFHLSWTAPVAAVGASLLATPHTLIREQARSHIQTTARGATRNHAKRPTVWLHAWMIAVTLGFAVAPLLVGCGDSAQKKAYEHAIQAEQQFSAESAAAIVAEYRQVIALRPGSEWAAQAQTHIELLEARLKAEELHKSVFQEHGVD